MQASLSTCAQGVWLAGARRYVAGRVGAEAATLFGLVAAVALVFGYGYESFDHRPFMVGSDGLQFVIAVFKQPLWRATALGPVYSPFQGTGDIFLPLAAPLIPHLFPLAFTNDVRTALPLIYTAAAVTLAVASYAFYRAIGVSRGVAAAAAGLAPILALWLDELTFATPQYVHGATMGYLILTPLALVGRAGRWGNLLLGGVFAVLCQAFVVSDVNAVIMAAPVVGVVGAALLLAARSRQEAAWKLGAGVAAGVLALGLGVAPYAVNVTSGTARYLFAEELIPSPQFAFTRGRLFALDGPAVVVTVLFLGGTVAALWHARGTVRRVAGAALVLVGLALVAGFLWGHTDFRWTGPAPAYFHVAAYPLVALFATEAARRIGMGVAAATREAQFGPRSRLGTVLAALFLAAAVYETLTVPQVVYISPPFPPEHYVKVWRSLAYLLVGLGALSQVWRARGGSRVDLTMAGAAVWLVLVLAPVRLPPPAEAGHTETLVQHMGLVPTPVHDFLRERVGLIPGNRFEGYADSYFPSGQPIQSVTLEAINGWIEGLGAYQNAHTVYGLHVFDIPTASQFSTYVTPTYYRAFTRLLNRPEEFPGIAVLSITRPNVAALRLMGVRYLVTNARGAVDVAAVPAGVREVFAWGLYRVYEIEGANVADYSPTVLQRVADAREVLDTLDASDFDPTRMVLVGQEDADGVLPEGASLVPIERSELRIVPGGFRISAQSPGRSLVVLPVQFNHCLSATVLEGDPAARLVRVNLFQTGLAFERAVVLEARYDHGGLAVRCAVAEREDAQRLGLGALVTPRRLPGWTHQDMEARWRLFAGTRWSAVSIPPGGSGRGP